MKYGSIFVGIFAIIAVLAFQNCNQLNFTKESSSSTSSPDIPTSQNSGNGGVYEGKIVVLHHYDNPNFKCEGRAQPEAILTRKADSIWYLTENKVDKCKFINEAAVSGVDYDSTNQQARYNNEDFLVPKPYFVIGPAAANSADFNLLDGVCEDAFGNCTLVAAIQQSGVISSIGPVLIHVPSGTYILKMALDLKISGYDITLKGALPNRPIIDGSDAVDLMKISGGPGSAQIQNFIFQNGMSLARMKSGASITTNNFQGGLTISNSVFQSNLGPAAVWLVGGTNFLIEDSVFSQNSQAGLIIDGSSNVVMRNLTLDQNNNSGMNLNNCQNCRIENSTFDTNSQGIILTSTLAGTYDFNINNSTFSQNGVSGAQGALNVGFANPGSTLYLNNTIVFDDDFRPNCYWLSAFHNVVSSYSIFQDTTCGAFGGFNRFGDPQLQPLANNGGLTPTMLPRPSSPVIGQGNNLTCASVDQRGISRPQNGVCDIGAVEQ